MRRDDELDVGSKRSFGIQLTDELLCCDAFVERGIAKREEANAEGEDAHREQDRDDDDDPLRGHVFGTTGGG